MTTLLQINSSLYADEGQSSQLASEFVADWQASFPCARVIVRNLARDPVPHLDADRFTAFVTPPASRTPDQQRHVAFSDALIEELQAADVLVLGLPMYNFGVPSTLKAYFDHVARAGVTFRYTEAGSEGMLRGKRAFVFTARGGYYADTPRDTQTAYVRNFLALLGIEDVSFVHAEGLARGPEPRARGLDAARTALHRLLEPKREAR